MPSRMKGVTREERGQTRNTTENRGFVIFVFGSNQLWCWKRNDDDDDDDDDDDGSKWFLFS